MLSENISAISSSMMPSGVGIIRISGDSPLKVAEKMFEPVGKTPVKDFEPYRMYPGEIKANGFNDFGLLVYFKAPKSYTGEDVVEFHCHGGIAILKGVLQKTFELGCKPATRGEFTKRAFLNGKLSLSSAEGLIDMINSEHLGEVKAGYSLYREKLKNRVDEYQKELKNVLAHIDVNMDFPEEDLEEATVVEIEEKLISIKEKTDELVEGYREGRKVKNGVKVAIVGKPNTGKSSLLNRFLGYDKAIVSATAGTTRDIVEGDIDIGGVRFAFSDTAGIRESLDEIEGVGIDKAKKTINESDLVLFVVDGSKPLTKEDEELKALTDDKNRITVVNKIDKKEENGATGDVYVSAKTGENVEKLKEKMYDACVGTIDLNGEFLTEERHYLALKNASDKLSSAIKGLRLFTLDLVSIDVKAAWEALGEISGETASQKIIDEIFDKFCVGK